MKKTLVFLCFIMMTQQILAKNLTELSPGGSNYAMYDIGNYLNVSTEKVWYSGELKPVIGTYHLNKSLVNSQMKEMYDNGQRKISFVLWFIPQETMPSAVTTSNVWGHTVGMISSSLSGQHQSNVKELIRKASQIGYNEIIFRFAGAASADPSDWNTWNENMYQRYWNLVVNTRALITDSVLNGVKVTYDLGVEYGGVSKNQKSSFVRRLWSDYVQTFGNNDSYGFSIAWGKGRLSKLIQDFDSTGVRPNSYAIDMYSNIYEGLGEVKKELNNVGEGNKKIVILETYSSNQDIRDVFLKAKKDFNLNIPFIIQWPLEKNSKQKHFSMDYNKNAAAYIRKSPRIDSAGTGGSNNYSIWILGDNWEHTDNSISVDIRLPNSSKIEKSLSGNNIRKFKYRNRTVITLNINSTKLKNALNSTGLNFWVVNPRDGTWSNHFLVKR